jgi:hypothetical protein
MECRCLDLLGLIRSVLATMPDQRSDDYPFVKLATDVVRDMLTNEYARIADRHESHIHPPTPKPLGHVG